MGFSRQEYWRGLPYPPPGDLPVPGIEPVSPALPVGSLPLSPWETPRIAYFYFILISICGRSSKYILGNVTYISCL